MVASPANPGRDHIVILGASKTGTTGLYASVKRGLRNAGIDAQTVFEPRSATQLDTLFRLAPGTPVMTKTTLDAVDEVVPDPLAWDRRVMTVRDPRDMLISALLFRPLTRRSLERTDEPTLEQFLAALERKEADPSSVSVRQLFVLARDLKIGSRPFKGLRRDLQRQQVLLEQFDFHPVRYENFVLGKIDELSDYLGFPVENVRDTKSTAFGHISRSASSGEFTRWFRPDDLAFFNKSFGDALDAFGYERDITLDENPTIDPSTASEYIRTRYHERRAILRHASEHTNELWSPLDVETPEAFDALIDLAGDGNPVAALRVAEVALAGHLGTPDPVLATRWARIAAQRGSPAALSLVVGLLEREDSSAPAVHREIRFWRCEMRRHDESSRTTQRTSDFEADLVRLKDPAMRRVGRLLAGAARHPRRNGPTATRELRRMWRHRKSRR